MGHALIQRNRNTVRLRDYAAIDGPACNRVISAPEPGAPGSGA